MKFRLFLHWIWTLGDKVAKCSLSINIFWCLHSLFSKNTGLISSFKNNLRKFLISSRFQPKTVTNDFSGGPLIGRKSKKKRYFWHSSNIEYNFLQNNWVCILSERLGQKTSHVNWHINQSNAGFVRCLKSDRDQNCSQISFFFLFFSFLNRNFFQHFWLQLFLQFFLKKYASSICKDSFSEQSAETPSRKRVAILPEVPDFHTQFPSIFSKMTAWFVHSTSY